MDSMGGTLDAEISEGGQSESSIDSSCSSRLRPLVRLECRSKTVGMLRSSFTPQNQDTGPG